METSFSELKCKQVINVVDGKSLGRIIDIILDVKTCKALGLVVPNPNSSMWSLFRSGKEIFIPFNNICKIGLDVILVELYSTPQEPCCDKPPKVIKAKTATYTLPESEYKIN